MENSTNLSEDLSAAIEGMGQRIRAEIAVHQSLRKLAEAQREYEDALAHLDSTTDFSQWLPGVASVPETSQQSSPLSLRKRGMKQVDCYEAIIMEKGCPMTLEDITQAAIERGMTWGGIQEKDPLIKVRNSLFGAKNKFVNLGDNIWWVTKLPVPEGFDAGPLASPYMEAA